jgi:tetratricopeptide (TPR) repeat protein
VSTVEPVRVSKVVDHLLSFRTKKILMSIGALLLICSAVTLFAQIDPGQFINGNLAGMSTVSRNQLLAPGKALQAVKRARADFAGGHLESARKEIARALDIAPHFAVAKVMKGAMDIETGEYDEATILFQEAIDEDPALGGAYVGMAVALIHERQFQAALPLLDRAEGLLPGAWFVRFAKAWAQMELGKTDAALKQADLAERLAGRGRGKKIRCLVFASRRLPPFERCGGRKKTSG